MLITNETLESLRVTLDFSFYEKYEATPTFYQELCTTRPSQSKKNVYPWIAQQLTMREWVGPRQIRALTERKFEVENRKFEITQSVLREEIEDDNLDLYSQFIFPEMGRAAKQFPDELLKEIIQSNPVTFDGLTLFNDAHPTFDDAGTTYDNNFGLALTADNFNTVWSAMASFTGENGQPLGVMPNLLVVPPQLRKVALEITSAPLILQNGTGSAAPTNVLNGWASVLVLPHLANAPTTWYLADTSRSIKPFVFQDRIPFSLVSKVNDTDDNVFADDVMLWGGRQRCEIAPTMPFLISKSTP